MTPKPKRKTPKSKGDDLDRMLRKHLPLCGIKEYSNPDRKCTCGRDNAILLLADLRRRAGVTV